MKKILWPSLIMIFVIALGVLIIKPIINNISYGIDLQGGFEILYRVEPLIEGNTLDSDDIEETLDIIGRKRGCIVRGGIVDYDKVYSVIMNDIKSGLIKGITFDRYDERMK